MTCDDIRRRLEANATDDLPDKVREHAESCAACRGLLDEERLWRRFFSAAPEPTARRPAWPGVLARIREEEDRRASLSDALLFFSRRLAPAFALVVLFLGGLGLWSEVLTEPRQQVPVAIAMLESLPANEAWAADEPDAVLNAWVGAQGR